MVEKRSGGRLEPKPRTVSEKSSSPEKHRVQLDFSQRSFEGLEHLQNQTGGSKTDVVHLGQTLLEWVVDDVNVKPGEPFKLKAKDGTWHTIYLPIPKH